MPSDEMNEWTHQFGSVSELFSDWTIQTARVAELERALDTYNDMIEHERRESMRLERELGETMGIMRHDDNECYCRNPHCLHDKCRAFLARHAAAGAIE